jgi:hypothetical protein
MPHRLLKLDGGAWMAFLYIQLQPIQEWILAHPTSAEFGLQLIKTAVCATLYFFVLRFWKKRHKNKT